MPRSFFVFFVNKLSKVGDLVGFSEFGGYLSSGTATKYGNINWITMQPQMQSIDSYLLHSLKTAAINDLPNLPIPAEVAIFIGQGTAEYNLKNPKFPVFNGKDIVKCSSSWASMTNRLFPYYLAALPPSTFMQQMIYFDQKNAKEFKETESFFQSNAECASAAIDHWWKSILSPNVTPAQAVQDVAKFVQNLYQNRACG